MPQKSLQWSVNLLSVVFALAIFFAVTGPGLLFEGNNSDDWRHVTGLVEIWSRSEGRWLIEPILTHLFGGKFLVPIQIALAFCCFVAIAALLSFHASGSEYSIAFGALFFVLGVNHIYMADALNFNAHVFAFSLGLLLSALAFHVMLISRAVFSIWNAVLWLVAIQCIAFTLAIYQPFALFGVILPIIGLFRWDKYQLSEIVKVFVLSTICCVLGLVLHKIEWSVLMHFMGREIEPTALKISDFQGISDSLLAFPRKTLSLLSGGFMGAPSVFRLVQVGGTGLLLFSVVVLALTGIRSAVASERRPSIDAARVVVASGLALFVCPLLLWVLAKTPYFPARAVAYFGFWFCAVAVATHTIARKSNVSMRSRLLVSSAAILAAAVLALSNAAWSKKLWTERTQLSVSELKLARQILEDVRNLPAYDGGAIRLVGDRRLGFAWGGSLNRSVFHGNNPFHGIFHGGLGTPWRAEAVEMSPMDCPAFPDKKSVFLYEGDAYVCLSQQIGVFPLQDCADLNTGQDERLCRSGEKLIRHIGHCDQEKMRKTYLLAEDKQGNRVVFDGSYNILQSNENCYQAASNQSLSVGEVAAERFLFGKGPVDAARYYYPIPNNPDIVISSGATNGSRVKVIAARGAFLRSDFDHILAKGRQQE